MTQPRIEKVGICKFSVLHIQLAKRKLKHIQCGMPGCVVVSGTVITLPSSFSTCRVAVLVVNDDTSIIASILDPQTRQLAFTFEQGDDVTVEDMYAGLRARGIDTDNKDLFTINNCLVCCCHSYSSSAQPCSYSKLLLWQLY